MLILKFFFKLHANCKFFFGSVSFYSKVIKVMIDVPHFLTMSGVRVDSNATGAPDNLSPSQVYSPSEQSCHHNTRQQPCMHTRWWLLDA